MALARIAFLAVLAAMAPALAVATEAPASPSSSAEPVLPPIAAPSDADLERVVRAAYSGAAAFALAHGNYFSRDGVFPPLHDAVRAELLEEGLGEASVPEIPAESLAAAKACLWAPGTALRIVTTTYGDGLALVAVSNTRDFVFDYDPHKAGDIKITPAEACGRPKG